MQHTSSSLLPTTQFGPYQVTRLIVGGNPIRGYSHRSAEVDAAMREYHDEDHTLQTFFRCEEVGINTMQSRGDAVIYNHLRNYRERGGTMHWICQTAGEHPDIYENIREIATYNPIAIYHHGSMSDKFWKDGSFDKVEDYLKAIRDTGKMVGIAAHMPEVLHHVEDNGWDVDFYMTCFYNLGKVQRMSLLAGGERVEEPFDDEDREVILRFINGTDKPCIAYKILAASRKCESPDMVKEAFRFAFDHIKPTDPVNVGMFQKDADQVGQNAAIVRELLGD